MKLRLAALLANAFVLLVSGMAHAVDLTQHGLTGSWYEPATSGQGLEVEVFPGVGGAGSALYQVSWFTFDTVAGGAERQRWYTASGAASSSATSVALTLYRNSGGNFDAGPVTAPQAIGTGSLQFDTCTSGRFDYTLFDGSGLAGSIALTRLTQNVTCTTGSAPTTNADFAYSGNWYAPATSGQGITVEVNPASGTLFFAWYTYPPSGAAAGATGQRWYTAQGAFAPGMRSIPLQLYETTGGVFDATAPSPVTVAVGDATLLFTSCTSATLDYAFTAGSNAGRARTIGLSRIGPTPPGCAPASDAGAEGIWHGTASDGRAVTIVVLDDRYYIAYSNSGGDSIDGGLYGTAVVADGRFESIARRNVPLRGRPFAGGSAAVSGTYVAKTSLDLVIGAGATAETVNATYDTAYDHAVDVAAVAGSYRGVSGHQSDAYPSTMSVAATGRFTVHGGCDHSGSITPRGSTGVFDVRFVNGCLPPTAPAQTGIALFDAARGTLTMIMPLYDNDMVMVFGTRQ